MLYYDLFGRRFWSSVLGVSFVQNVFVSVGGYFVRDFYVGLLKMEEVFWNFFTGSENIREFVMGRLPEVVRRVGDKVEVLDKFVPTKKQVEFAEWVVENSGSIKFEKFNIAELARLYGRVSVNVLYRWYRDPGFVKWFNEYCVSRLGFAVAILKSSVVMDALRKDATLEEKKFALQLMGELDRGSKGGGLNIYILGNKVSITDAPKEEGMGK